MADTQLIEQERQVKKLKRDFEGWREIILMIHSILMWEKQWYPAVIGICNTIVFLIFWLWDPSILTTVAILLLIVNIADWIIPQIISTFYKSESWTGSKEKQFENICKSIVNCQFQLMNWVRNWQELKNTKPKLYYIILITSLLFISWIGNIINNLLLTYLITTIGLFLPGVMHHQIFDRHVSILIEKMSDIFNMFRSKVPEKEKTS